MSKFKVGDKVKLPDGKIGVIEKVVSFGGYTENIVRVHGMSLTSRRDDELTIANFDNHCVSIDPTVQNALKAKACNAKFKVGDKVTDGNSIFRITAVNPSDYEWDLVKGDGKDALGRSIEEGGMINWADSKMRKVSKVAANAFPIKSGATINVMEALMDAYINDPGTVYQDMCEALEDAGYVIDQGDRRGIGYQKADAVLRGGSRVTTVPAQLFATKTRYFDTLAAFFDANAKKTLRQVLPADVFKGLEDKTIEYDRFSDKFVPVRNSRPKNSVVENAIAWKAKNAMKFGNPNYKAEDGIRFLEKNFDYFTLKSAKAMIEDAKKKGIKIPPSLLEKARKAGIINSVVAENADTEASIESEAKKLAKEVLAIASKFDALQKRLNKIGVYYTDYQAIANDLRNVHSILS